MDRFSWLESQPAPDAGLAPPPVLFGFSSNTNLQKPPDHHYMFANASADNIAARLQDPDSIPLSLTAQDLTLEESKTYMRWYLDILARTNLRTVSMADVFQFLSNFRLTPAIKDKIARVFGKIMALINIGEFFALLRVVAHTLAGHEPSRALIAVKTSVPVPPSILSKKRQNDDDDLKPPPDEPSKPLDLDLFTQFMLTGERPDDRTKRPKKLKSVTFSDEVVTAAAPDMPTPADEPLDYLLPMDQLLSRLQRGSRSGSLSEPLVASPDPEEKQMLQEMAPQFNYFRNLHSVDTMLVDGVPANIHLQSSLPQPLQPNMTGPAQMAQLRPPAQDQDDMSPLRPNVTGPADMSRIFAPNGNTPAISLQSFTSQMTGDTVNNTEYNAHLGRDEKQLPPPPVPATRRARSLSQPSPVPISWPNGVALGSDLPTPPEQNTFLSIAHRQRAASASPAPLPPPRSPLGSRPVPPLPPPSRRRGSSLVPSPVLYDHLNIDQVIDVPPPLPDKIPNNIYQHADSSSSTANILDDLKALQEEVDRIRDMTGGF